MTGFNPLDLALLALAAAGAGVINTIVGSGSLVTFPTLLLGVPAVPANMANTVGLAIGNVGGVLGYRRELRGQWRSLAPLIVLTVGVLGLTTADHLQRANAAKNVLQTIAGVVATVVFIIVAPLPWTAIVIIAVASLLGSGPGAMIGRRLPGWLLRTLIIAIGVIAVIALVR
ncbi:TSUP family transporter [Microbacterium sp.]|uniref:TSUP family transporter n=1 Tax=Microbacterium sp. TaxID=51671 RepID=UPI003A8F81DB